MPRTLLALSFLLLLVNTKAQVQNITIQLNVQHAACGNTTGAIAAWVWGGAAPYSFLWSPAPPTGQGTSNAGSLPPGEYTLTVTDANANEASATATVLLVPGLFPDITMPNPAGSCTSECNGYWNLYIPLPGGAMPYTAVFDPPGPTGGGSPNGLYFNGLCPGETYTVTITDVNGCSGTITNLEVVGPLNPEILNLSVSPACPGGSNGGFVVEFTDADSIIVSNGPFGGTQLGSHYTATNLPAGSYPVVVSAGISPSSPPGTSGGTWCTQTFVIVVPESTDPCGTLSGSVYADLDGDCAQGSADAGLPFRVLHVQPGDHHILSDAAGAYSSAFFYGSYALDASISGYDPICPALPAGFTLDAVNTSVAIDLAMAPLNGPDAFVSLQAGAHRPGFPVTYTVTVHNDGPYAISNIDLSLAYDPLLNFTSANGSPVSAGGGSVQWSIATLAPFSTTQLLVQLAVPPNASLIGTVVNSTATILGDEPDSDPSNDTYSISRTIIGAYDPNDKLASTSSRSSDLFYFLDADQWVDYTIRFQNTGTAEAINAHLTDTLSPLLNISSLQILGASHAFTAQLLPGRVLRFDFPGILLPDSASDLLGSQGFASFRLRPTSNLSAGDLLANNADIFFDFNEPVRTNTVVLQAEFSTGLSATEAQSTLLSPNPVHDVLMVTPAAGTLRVEVIAADGRTMHAMAVRDSIIRIPVLHLPAGLYKVRCIGASGPTGTARFIRQ
jgi:uncharacterized repeat protein (TIGR01451 family)